MAKEGYTRLSNELMSFLCSCDLNATELKVLLFLIRYSKGFRRDTVRAGYSYIAKGTRCSERTVRRALKVLIEKGYVSVLHEHSGSAAQILKVMWSNMTISCGQVCPYDVVNSDHINVVNSDHQDNKEDNKDIHKRIYKEKASLEELSAMSWEEDKNGDL